MTKKVIILIMNHKLSFNLLFAYPTTEYCHLLGFFISSFFMQKVGHNAPPMFSLDRVKWLDILLSSFLYLIMLNPLQPFKLIRNFSYEIFFNVCNANQEYNF